MKKLFAPLIALALIAPGAALANKSWTFLVDGEDGTLWFARNARQYDNLTFVDVKTEEDPDGNNGEENLFIDVYDCKNKTVKDAEEGKMTAVKMDKIEGYIYKFACKK